MNRTRLLTGIAMILLPSPLLAQPSQEQPSHEQRPAPPQDHLHEQAEEEIVVTAPFVRELDLLAGTSTLSGNALARDLQPQLGDTLARLPGVSATSFSPGASRPVLRGFQGERVRVLVDGIGSIDVSNTSADHAVTIDPITADRIEVLHGPAVLLFGGQAIGGAVNVFDRRIPRRVPDDKLFHIDALAAYGSAANERSIAGGVDFSVGGGLVLHLDGSYRNTDDLDTGGFILSPELRAEQLAIAQEEEAEGHLEEAAEARELAGRRGILPNSATEQTTGGFGIALIRDWGSIGGSVSLYESRYGIPSRPGGGHHHDGEGEEGEAGEEHGDVPVSIDLEQFRGDLRGDIALGGGVFERLRLRFAAADYQHIEFEGDEVGTLFETEGLEGRFELVQADRGGWRGVVGGQFFRRDFDASGAEAFLRANKTDQIGLFTLQEIDIGESAQIEAALRYEHSNVDSQFFGIERSFDAFSAAVGGSYEISPLVRVGLNLSRSERAPTAEELYSNGPHVATQAFEIGDPTFDTESSVGGELFVRAQRGSFQMTGTLFYNSFDNYIFAAETGEEEDELPVFQYIQTDAEYWGFEFGVDADVAQIGDVRLSLEGVADYVEARIIGGGPVPRIPPMRVRGGVEARTANLEGRFEVEHVFEQDRTASFETPTQDFTLVNAAVTWRPFGADSPTSLILSANNLLDVEARRHASFTKDFVPLPGRDLRATLRVSF